MGNDGGTILRRSDLVRARDDGSDAKVDPAILAKVLATTCAISRQPLCIPIVSDGLGYLYNKDSIVKLLLSKAESKKENRGKQHSNHQKFSHIKKLKDVQTLNLKENLAFSKIEEKGLKYETTEEDRPAPFICPLNQREMNGRHRFVYIKPCGCVMSESGLRAMISDDAFLKNGKEENNISSCPVCSKAFSIDCIGKKSIGPGGDVIVLNGTEIEVEAQRLALEHKRLTRKMDAKVANGTTEIHTEGAGHKRKGKFSAEGVKEVKRSKK